MKVQATTIPRALQQYETDGDWFAESESDGELKLRILVSEELSEIDRWCTVIHELIEAFLCIHRFGAAKATRVVQRWDDTHHGDCPYKKYHDIANAIRTLFRVALNQ